MIICRVVGSAVSTIKNEALRGYKLLVCEEVSLDRSGKRLSEGRGGLFIAVDASNAGEGDMVAVVQDSPAARALNVPNAPVDAVVVAILDSVSIHGETIKGKG
ncbi:MAG: EutN/CcmL family microcompartment protein [Ignavibacteriales bacterium]